MPQLCVCYEVYCPAKFILPSDSYTAVPDFNSMGVGQLASCWKILKQLRLKISKWNITRRLHLITTCNLKISTLGKNNVKYPFKSQIPNYLAKFQIDSFINLLVEKFYVFFYILTFDKLFQFHFLCFWKLSWLKDEYQKGGKVKRKCGIKKIDFILNTLTCRT